MKLYRILIALILSATVLVGCSTSNDFSMGIVKTDQNKSPVKYGMGRSEVEKILGEGDDESSDGQTVYYGKSLRLWYRDDKISGIELRVNSEEAYVTTSGVKAGMVEDDIKKIYGEKFYSDMKNGGRLTYYYDTETKEIVNQETEQSNKKLTEAIREKPEGIYVLKFKFDKSGYLWEFSMTDSKLGHHGE